MVDFLDIQTLEILSTICMDGIVVVDAEETVVYANENYLTMSGLNKEDVIGKRIRNVVKTSRLYETLKKKEPSSGFVHDLTENQLAYSKNKAVYTSTVPVLDKNGHICGAIGYVKSLEDSKKISALLQSMDDKLSFYENKLKSNESFYGLEYIQTSNLEMHKIKDTAKRIANSDMPALLMGETGTGKEVFATAIHNESNRKYGPFIKVNCASIPEALVESELFGYEEGAFTGAKKGGKAGKFELANNGTIFLDEIGELPLAIQSKLLRVIQENESERVGGVKPIKLNFRLIAATNQDLHQMTLNHTFREDLYYRLNVLPIIIPALRHRKEDIPALIDVFLTDLNKSYNTNISISQEAVMLITSQPLHGNVRELRNIIGRAFILSDQEAITVDTLDFLSTTDSSSGEKSPNRLGTLQMKEKDSILAALQENGYNISQTADELGIHRNTVYRKMKQYGIALQRNK